MLCTSIHCVRMFELVLYVIQHRSRVSALRFVAVGPDRDACAFECPGEASGVFPDYPLVVVRKLITDNLGNDNVGNVLTAERFKRTE
jgi:hypothetical protein